jgi:hypothetical protein
MGGFSNGVLGFGGWPGFFGGWDGVWGKHGGERKIVVITAVRAVAAKGDGIFDRNWW